jgi:hypothetical protein
VNIFKNTESVIIGLKTLLEDDFSARQEIENKVRQKIEVLELLDDDEDAIAANKLLKRFLQECENHSKKIDKLQIKESIWESALVKTNNEQNRRIILDKLAEIDKDKKTFV